MKYYKKLKLAHSKSKTKWWSIGLIWGLIFTFGIINFGCEKDYDNGDEINNSNEYYVKYEINSSTIYYGGKLNVTISTDNNTSETISVNQRTEWETVIGPVQKDFNAILKVVAQGETHNHLRLYARIYVSKNNSPFALKEIDGSDTPRDLVQINYTIDY